MRTNFMDIQRRVGMYLRALWGSDFIMKQSDLVLAEDENRKPFIEDFHIHLPDALYISTQDGVRHVTGLQIYRAAAAHASAHIVYTNSHFSARSLDKWQIAMISMIEDARVETLSIRRFPGLKHLWAMQHKATPLDNMTAGDYLNRLARALLDETYQDDDPWISQGRALFKSAGNLEDNHVSRVIGLRLADSFREKKIKFNIHSDMLGAPYRDDNRFLWKRPGQPLEIINPYFKSRTTLRVDESGEDVKNTRVPTKKAESARVVLGTYYYPEWNYRSQSLDQSWVTLREMSSGSGDLNIVVRIIAENHQLLARMKTLLHAIRDGAVHRVRKLEEGDEIDMNAAIRAQINIRLGMPPDTRVMMRLVRKTRDISVLMLLDLSNSMNNKVQGRGHTALQLTQQVSVLFADAIEAVGDAFAIHGFCSENRHNVEYYRMKDFEQPYDDVPKARIAGMTGQLCTRMGAAIRHATYYLNKQKSSKKLLILISDGEPYDIDIPNRKYLRDDAKKSIEEAKRNGIHTYCISLDPGADKYVSRIFGAKNYIVVDHVKCLPEKILLIYAALTR
ncbi:MAG: nitric oxide reductase activation protein NorD [Gallionellaceae bacterium]